MRMLHKIYSTILIEIKQLFRTPKPDDNNRFEMYISPMWLLFIFFCIYNFSFYTIMSSMPTSFPDWFENCVWIYFGVSPFIILGIYDKF